MDASEELLGLLTQGPAGPPIAPQKLHSALADYLQGKPHVEHGAIVQVGRH